jgi:hypothetical protein
MGYNPILCEILEHSLSFVVFLFCKCFGILCFGLGFLWCCRRVSFWFGCGVLFKVFLCYVL